jgi:HK97 gp10 family phage protein
MSATIEIKFDRFPEITAAMPERASAVVRRASFDVEGQAKGRAPVDTGALKNSIGTEFENGGLTGIVAPHVEYAAFVEYGTKRMSAQPYMTPAAESVAPAFIAAMKQMLQEISR